MEVSSSSLHQKTLLKPNANPSTKKRRHSGISGKINTNPSDSLTNKHTLDKSRKYKALAPVFARNLDNSVLKAKCVAQLAVL